MLCNESEKVQFADGFDEYKQIEKGEFHDQGDAEWIVIRRQLRGHNDTPCGWPAPGRPIGRPQGVMDGF
jgi:hypothetical protein